MLSPYDNKTELTRSRIMGNRKSYFPNKYYKSAEGNFYFYINTRGYFHLIKSRKIFYSGIFSHYEIVNFLLTKENNLKECSSYGNYKTMEELKEAIKDFFAEE